MVILLIVSLGLRWQYVHVKSLDYDEGHWLMFGLLTWHGYEPYTQIFAGIPPLALWTIALGAGWFGTEHAVRYPTLLYSLVGIVAIYWIVYEEQHRDAVPAVFPIAGGVGGGTTLPLAGGVGGGGAALLAAVFLSFGPRYFEDSCQIMMEAPSIALSLLSLALAYYYGRTGALAWLFLSGLTFTLSLSLKIFPVFIPVLILLQLSSPLAPLPKGEGGRINSGVHNLREFGIALGRAGLVWLLGVSLPLLLYVLLYDPQGMFDQVIRFRVVIRDIYIALGKHNINDNLQLLKEEYWLYMPWLIGAGLSLVIQGKRSLRQNWLWLIWFLLANLILISHVPMRSRYSILLFPPLAVLSGIGAAILWQRLGKVPGYLMIIILMIMVLAGPVQSAIATPQSPLHGRHTGRADGINFIRDHTAQDDCIITDDQRFNLLAGRLAPPWLSEISVARLSTGWITFDDIVTAIDQNECPATVYVSGRMDGYIPELRDLLRNRYFLEMKFEDIDIYAIKKNVDKAPTHLVQKQLGSTIILKGYDILPDQQPDGQRLSLSTYWSVTAPMTNSYKIFVHFKNQTGQTVLQFDHYPFDGLVPTTEWIPGHTVKETFVASWPDDTLPAGTYQIYTGMYDEQSLVRLPVQNYQSGENAILLGTVRRENGRRE